MAKALIVLILALAAGAASAQLPAPPPAAPPPMGTDAKDVDRPPKPGEPPVTNSLVTGETPWVEWERSQGQENRLRAYGPDLLGDSIDPHTGALTFDQTDIAIPGNSHLEVSIKRRRSQGYTYGRNVNIDFGDWELLVPKISVVSVQGWTGARCSNSYGVSFPPFPTGTNKPTFYVTDYSHGVILQGQDGAPQQMLESPVSGPFPAGTKYVTARNWKITCIDDPTQAGANDGFLAVASNGDQYRFDRSFTLNHRRLGGMSSAKSGPLRNKTILVATQVTDVNGNTVNYSYDASNRLTQIAANDGRVITLTYGSTSYPNLITQACAHGRCWYYNYGAMGYAEQFEQPFGPIGTLALSTVTLPDGTYWQFSLGAMHTEPPPGPTYCTDTNTVQVTHPYGVVGVFVLSEKRLRNSLNAGSKDIVQCPEFDGGGGTALIETGVTFINVISVDSKTLSGPGVPSATWTFTYEQDEGAPDSSASDQTNWTKVTEPGGSEITYIHRWNAQNTLGGFLNRKEVRETAGGALLETTDTAWTAGLFLGSAAAWTSWSQIATTPTDVIAVTRGTAQYTTDNDYDLTPTSPTYSYGLPTQVTEGGNTTGGLTRVTNTVYAHNKTKWVLGLPASVTRNGKLFDEYTYDANGRVSTKKLFGALRETWTYSTVAGEQGAVATFKDGHTFPNHIWTLSNWKRGKPQTVNRPDGINFTREVNDLGEVKSETDARGFTTGFTYNPVGWLESVDLPNTNTPEFANISVSYAGQGSNLTETRTRGTKRTVISYDGMLRPTLVQTQALDGSATATYEKSEYDIFGKETFKSWPSFGSNPTTGVNKTYDALGRPLTSAENVPPFYATTVSAYPSGAVTTVTDPSNATVTTTTQGFGSPDKSETKQVVDPMGTTTTMSYDNWGNVTQLQQSGTNPIAASVTRQFTYDNELRLCRHKAPEFGPSSDEVFLYDVEGQLRQSGRGTAVAGTVCPTTIASASRVTRTYDKLHRETVVGFPSGTLDINREYDNNGNVTKARRGASTGPTWDYQYTALNAISQEKLTIDSRVYDFAYGYDANGSLSTRNGPGGNVLYGPDAFGRPTRITWPGITDFVNPITYHPNGLPASAAFINGQTMTQTLTNRLTPDVLKTVKAGANAVWLTYGYEARGKVNSIVDSISAAENRTFQYDPNGRLFTSTGPWGSGNYGYDALSNVRSIAEGGSTTTVSYDANNRVATAAVTGQALRSFTYDDRGNTSNDGRKAFTWDLANQAQRAGGIAGQYYDYDANLKRVKQSGGGTGIVYLMYSRVTGGLIYRDESGNSKTTAYLSAGGASVRLVSTSGGAAVPAYIHTDHLGSSSAATDATGAITWRESYHPFGKLRLAPAANDNNTGYTGHLHDKYTSVVNMQARLYDPQIGRFFSTDPIGYQDQLNLYAYVANDPVNKVDPNGEQAADFIMDQRNAALAAFAKDNPAVAVAAGAVVAVAAAAEIGAMALANPVAAAEISTAIGEIAAGDALGASGAAGLGGTALFRAVDGAELADIAQNGLRLGPNGAEVKSFVTNSNDAQALANTYSDATGEAYSVIGANAPDSVMQGAERYNFTDVPGQSMEAVAIRGQEQLDLCRVDKC